MRIRAFPDTTGYAPASEAWHAYDIDTFDTDCDERGFFSTSLVGTGATAEAAIADFLQQMEEEDAP